MKKTARKDAPVAQHRAAGREKPVAPHTRTAPRKNSKVAVEAPVIDAPVVPDTAHTPVHVHAEDAPQAQEKTIMLTLKLKGLGPKGEARYISTDENVSGLIVIGRNLVAEGFEFPGTLEIDGLEPAAPKVKAAKEPKEPKVKLTPEEKAAAKEAAKAARAAMTPQERLDAKEAQLAKQAANLAARKAKLAAAAAAPAAEATM